MLSHKDKESILKEFPNIKLSYENITHKKVYNSDFIIGIPQGQKCFTWFTIYNDNPGCFILELDSKGKITDISLINTCFSERLASGTVFYGTLFYHNNNNFFSVEDIFYYKGFNCSRENWENKFKTISNIFKSDIKQISYNNNFIVFGIPIISNSHLQFTELLNNIKYKISSIQYRNLNRTNNYLTLSYDKFLNIIENKEICEPHDNLHQIKENKENKENIFIVKPDIQNDIYYLFLNEEFKGLACVPDYKTSMMLNKLFRNIKENIDLDALEESDDEEEFENPNVDKFVHLERNYKMICSFNKKFKKWVPIRVL